ncbi:D-alanyl-D-alanine carboxypeptidase/D-alanyl-D-alanine endopeptidase [Streptacidiphilus carbonis]|uniref:D-alanyl-D-alanine carboxypeptidase/D-alanyl-D-alanine endopeptidase n=1 Tax=Streptacidiphilus carbonis TaxID=105422 RepID=UPI0005A892A2|nr:D-alanyl-D-alanine carboxypeptidase/D-alanyl-D-alanine-endopeptidase [Streptacidiphilus carbonis]
MGSWWGAAARGYALAPTRTVAVVSGALGLALAAGGIAAAGPWAGGQRVAEHDRGLRADRSAGAVMVRPRPVPAPSWVAPPAVLKPAAAGGSTAAAGSSGDAAAPTAGGLTAALGSALSDPVLGQFTASVVDAATGRTLYASGQDTPLAPASTNKIATSVAALSLLGPEHRFTTRVVSTAPGRIVLVGGGDPTLSAAGLAALADRTAAALKASGTGTVRLGYDISLFGGPAQTPAANVGDNIALVQALTVDEGRLDPHSTEDAPRYGDPAATAAAGFAALLGKRGITVQGSAARTTAPAAAKAAAPLAQLQSQPLSEIVERMLTESDNDYAEDLGHQTAVAAGLPATFAGGAAAVMRTLTRLGVPLGRTHLVDSSGLSSADGIPAAVLTRLLLLASSPAHPELRAAVSGLPVAGYTGTLADRFSSDSSSTGLGLVRAKTGSLSTVNTLAGLVLDRDGRLLAFSFMSNAGGDVTAARDALDRLAARVAVCGCR